MNEAAINERAARVWAKNVRLCANHACTIAACVRAGMKNGFSFKLIGVKHIDREDFAFLPEKTLFGEKTKVIAGAEKWFRYSYNKLRMCNIKAVLPEAPTADEENADDFGLGLACLFEDGSASLFLPEWEYNANTDKWSVTYRQTPCEPALAKARFADPTEKLRDTITALCDFCADIRAEDDTGLLLCGLEELDTKEASWELASHGEYTMGRIPAYRIPKLSEKSAHLYRAAARTPVFGGTWFHTLHAKAAEIGREDEFTALMEELFAAQRSTMLYTVNES